ncbi:MAG TPA: hypothetical protein VK832_07620, partial [Burkholderiaceae bacterium]|nr:hypothetical protein [Burkholderiaceae bacterium]
MTASASTTSDTPSTTVALEHRRREPLTVIILVALILGLPIAVWLDLVNLTDASLRRQASDLNAMITGIRTFYSSDVVDRV